MEIHKFSENGIADLPDNWVKAYKNVNAQLGQNAILCGGALRAILLQRLYEDDITEHIKINDLDIQGPHAPMPAEEQYAKLQVPLLAGEPAETHAKAMTSTISKGEKEEHIRRLDILVNPDDYARARTLQVCTMDFYEGQDPVEAFFRNASLDIFQIAWKDGALYMSDAFAKAVRDRVIKANLETGWDNMLDIERNIKKALELLERPEFEALGFGIDMSHLPEELLEQFEARLDLAPGFLSGVEEREQEPLDK
jgi:hypothetical protein